MPLESVYSQYRAELNGPRTTASARVGTAIVIGLNTAFIALDWWARPSQFNQLLAVRLLWDVAMFVVYWRLASPNPLRTMLGGLYLSGLGMLSVIGLAGGVTSSYWPGMMILFLGIPVVLPLSVRQASAVVTVLSLGFVGLPLVSRETLTLQAFLVPVFFVCGAAIECVASTAALERLRLTDFERRNELEKTRDHLREMDRLKARFTANVHHELRTPLTLTLAPLESLLSGELGDIAPQQRSYLETMRVNAQRLLKLINNLLDLAKAESNELAVRRRPTSLGHLVEELVRGAQPFAAKKGVDLRWASESTVGGVNVDPEAVEKVLMNLLGNSLKFTGPGGSIHVEVTADEKGGAHVEVRDTGEGLAESELERIFDRFAQVDTSATRNHEGTGIGLSLARELVELHGGTIWAESPGIGLGTSMHVRFPQGEVDEASAEVLLADENYSSPPVAGVCEGNPPAGGAASSHSLHYAELERHVQKAAGSNAMVSVRENEALQTILVCEDNDDMRRLLRDLLSKEFNVRLARNGREGLEEVLRKRPDLVLTDVMMPEMSGIELCERLKGDPATRGIPVILVTSKAEREMKIAGLENGADDYVTKPFHSRELMARVRSFLRLKSLQDELAKQNRALESANGELSKTMCELKEAEAHMVHTERLAAAGELAAGIAHEVNNPVNFARTAAKTMTGYVAECRAAIEELRKLQNEGGRSWDRIGGGSLDESLNGIEELAGIVTAGLDRTSKLVGDLRDLSAPGNGERSRVNVAHIVDSAMQLTRYALQNAGATVKVYAAADLPPVIGNEKALGQVFLNLLKNAAEAFETPNGCVWVKIAFVDSRVLVTVRDNGPGMSSKVLGQIFEPFFSTKPAGKGTGLGLSISRQITVDHGGSLEVVSEVGGGTEFSVWLPADQDHGE